MSYEPNIIVERKDLMTIRNQLWVDEVSKVEDTKLIAKELISALNRDEVSFKNMSLIIFRPEFTSFNEKVRKYLAKHKIVYATDY